MANPSVGIGFHGELIVQRLVHDALLFGCELQAIKNPHWEGLYLFIFYQLAMPADLGLVIRITLPSKS